MSALTSLNCRLTSEDAASLLSLPESELETFLLSLQLPARRETLLALAAWRTERETLEGSLHGFVQGAWHVLEGGPFRDGWHIRGLCQHLEEMARNGTTIRDLLINQPPGTMKSLLVAVFLPCFVWGPLRQQHTRWLFASYSDHLTVRDSVSRRKLLNSEWFQSRWPIGFNPEQDSKTNFANESGGWMFATSVGGAGTGEHPNFIVIDDPHKASDVFSPERRERALRWWQGTISNRGLILDVRRIVVMQRLHREDLSGHLLRSGEPWTHICLPLEFEPGRMKPTPLGWTDERLVVGENLWPEGITDDVLRRLKSMAPSDQSGQLQQRPPDHDQDAEWPASYFPESIWSEWPSPLEIAATVVYLDPSLGKTEKSDFSAFVTLSLTHEGVMHVECDMERRDASRMSARAVEIASDVRPIAFGIESNGFQSLLAGEIERLTRGHGMPCPIWQVQNTENKIGRIRRLTPYLQQGLIRVLDTSGGRLLVEQLRAFPGHRHDDGPDALEGAIQLLLRLTAAEEQEIEEVLV